MKQIKGNLWEHPSSWKCVLTNGMINTDGRAVMGGGCAKEAVSLIEGIDKVLGVMLASKGNHVHVLGAYRVNPVSTRQSLILSFPTKNDWRDPSDLGLIERSARELLEIWQGVVNGYQVSAQARKPPTVMLPRPGCGLGGLNWEAEVKPVIAEVLASDSFLVINNET